MFRDGVSIGTRVGTSFADSGLVASTAYEYTVKAVTNNEIESPLSESLTVTTEPGAGV